MSRRLASVLALSGLGLFMGSIAQDSYSPPYGRFLVEQMKSRESARAEPVTFTSAPRAVDTQLDTQERNRTPIKCISRGKVHVGSACKARL